jgi:hypothetical protein
MAETFYDVLGVSPDADEDAIDDAYRARIKETHPDVSDAADAQERTRKVIEAKDVLTDPDERARYDDLGHDGYVRQTTTDADWATDGSAGEAETSTAASQAADTDWSASSGEGSTWAGRGDWRDEEQAEERRRRARDAAGVSGERTDGTTVDGGTTADGGATSNVGGPVGWATSSRHAVRNDRERSGVHRSRLFPPGQSLVLLISAFICYPALVFSSLFPSFPLLVNLIVGICTLILVAYLTSMPEVGIYVFGAWTALGTLGLILTAVNPLSPVGLVVLLSTWFPFGLTVLTYEVLRW